MNPEETRSSQQFGGHIYSMHLTQEDFQARHQQRHKYREELARQIENRNTRTESQQIKGAFLGGVFQRDDEEIQKKKKEQERKMMQQYLKAQIEEKRKIQIRENEGDNCLSLPGFSEQIKQKKQQEEKVQQKERIQQKVDEIIEEKETSNTEIFEQTEKEETTEFLILEEQVQEIITAQSPVIKPQKPPIVNKPRPPLDKKAQALKLKHQAERAKIAAIQQKIENARLKKLENQKRPRMVVSNSRPSSARFNSTNSQKTPTTNRVPPSTVSTSTKQRMPSPQRSSNLPSSNQSPPLPCKKIVLQSSPKRKIPVKSSKPPVKSQIFCQQTVQIQQAPYRESTPPIQHPFFFQDRPFQQIPVPFAYQPVQPEEVDQLKGSSIFLYPDSDGLFDFLVIKQIWGVESLLLLMKL